MRLLVVEDDNSLNRIICKHLKEAGYAVDACSNGEDGLAYMSVVSYDCVILDWMLPQKNGLEVLAECRSRGYRSPILMLTAKDAVSDRVSGLDHGADDYLVKPFSFDELLARIRSLLRRNGDAKQSVLELADLTMDTASHTVARAGKNILLTSREYALLEYMLRNQGILLTRSQISDHIWNFDYDCDSNIVDVYVRYLRNKIDRQFSFPLIHTVRGAGYLMKDERNEKVEDTH